MFEKAPKKKIDDLVFEDISCMSLYWQENIESIAKNLKNQYAIQGNLDPKVLLESDEIIWKKLKKFATL